MKALVIYILSVALYVMVYPVSVHSSDKTVSSTDEHAESRKSLILNMMRPNELFANAVWIQENATIHQFVDDVERVKERLRKAFVDNEDVMGEMYKDANDYVEKALSFSMEAMERPRSRSIDIITCPVSRDVKEARHELLADIMPDAVMYRVIGIDHSKGRVRDELKDVTAIDHMYYGGIHVNDVGLLFLTVARDRSVLPDSLTLESILDVFCEGAQDAGEGRSSTQGVHVHDGEYEDALDVVIADEGTLNIRIVYVVDVAKHVVFERREYERERLVRRDTYSAYGKIAGGSRLYPSVIVTERYSPDTGQVRVHTETTLNIVNVGVNCDEMVSEMSALHPAYHEEAEGAEK